MALATSTAASLATTASQSMVMPAVTSIFTPAATASCSQGLLTMMENLQYEIWNNYPLPVPNTTISDCYPSQVMTSVLASMSGTMEGQFSPLACPNYYTTAATTWPQAPSNYIVCCPSSYTFAANASAPLTRPAESGTCYTNLPASGASILMTKYGNESISQTFSLPITTNGMQAYAIPFDGIATGTVPSITAAPTTASTSSVAASTYTVVAGTNSFSPSSVNAKQGDTVEFQFQMGNHSVTQSSFNRPCQPLANGISSGFMPNLDDMVPFPTFDLQVNVTGPQWYYSAGQNDCTSGMVFGLNPTSSQTEAQYLALAMSFVAHSSSGLSKGAKAGIAIGVILFVATFFGGLAFFLVRRRRNQAAPPYDGPPADYYALDYKEDHPPPVPAKEHELEGPRGQELYAPGRQFELAGHGPSELSGLSPALKGGFFVKEKSEVSTPNTAVEERSPGKDSRNFISSPSSPSTAVETSNNGSFLREEHETPRHGSFLREADEED